MTFDGFKIGFSPHSEEGEVCLVSDETLATSRVTIEDKITGLFEALRGSIHSYLVAVFGFVTAAEAEDITQDAFLQLHRMMQKGNQIDNPRAWLFRVAHNRAINRLKTQAFIAPLDDAGWDEVAARLPDTSPTPEQRAQRMEDFAQVHEAMKRLSLQERQCMHLRAEGLRYREIGDILEISTPAVGKYLRRAIKKLMLENTEIHVSGA
jgi:RNA polymerase sigma-70 factor (ECF subfamily)